MFVHAHVVGGRFLAVVFTNGDSVGSSRVVTGCHYRILGRSSLGSTTVYSQSNDYDSPTCISLYNGSNVYWEYVCENDPFTWTVSDRLRVKPVGVLLTLRDVVKMSLFISLFSSCDEPSKLLSEQRK